MLQPSVPKPINRSHLRLYLGKRYYRLRRWWKWQVSGTKFAKDRPHEQLPVSLITHKSTLLRKLKNVDMYLQHNKITNLQLAIHRLDRLVIAPGETFSFWYLVGNTTKRKGYKTGMNLVNGKVSPGTGGGLCQMGNLIFWMTIHTPLTIVERWRHSFDVFPDVNRTLPFGSGATLAYNYIDLQLRNDTDQAFQLHLWLDDTHLHGEIRTEKPLPHRYEVYEDQHQIRVAHWGGYTRHNQIRRKVIKNATEEEIGDELITENHAIMMYNPLLE